MLSPHSLAGQGCAIWRKSSLKAMRKPHFILLFTLLIAASAIYQLPALAFDPLAFRLADQRSMFGIAQFCNVISSLPLLFVGGFGMRRAMILKAGERRRAYLGFSIGVLLLGVASIYSHLTASFGIDIIKRVPISIAAMSLLALMLTERVWPQRKFFWVLLILDLLLAPYWFGIEMLGAYRSPCYLLLKHALILVLPLILLLFPSHYLRNAPLWAATALYALATLAGYYDHQIWDRLQIISGHSVEHLLTAASALCVMWALRDPVYARAYPQLPLGVWLRQWLGVFRR